MALRDEFDRREIFGVGVRNVSIKSAERNVLSLIDLLWVDEYPNGKRFSHEVASDALTPNFLNTAPEVVLLIFQQTFTPGHKPSRM